MVKRECDSLNLLMGSIDEAGDGELVRFVDRLWPLDGVNHGSCNDVWIDHHQVKRGCVLLHEFPSSSFRTRLGNVISKNNVIPFNCLLGCNLQQKS